MLLTNNQWFSVLILGTHSTAHMILHLVHGSNQVYKNNTKCEVLWLSKIKHCCFIIVTYYNE